MPQMKQPPNPVEETIRWCEANRPDIVGQLKGLEAGARNGNQAAEAAMFILSVAFAAGRTFQRVPEHADVYLPITKDPYT